MHELTIAQSVVDAVLERTGDRPVTTVRLQVGKLAGVVPDALQFGFDLVTAGTPLAGAALLIEEPYGEGRCRSCGERFPVEDLLVLCECGSADVELLGGRELQVTSVDVG